MSETETRDSRDAVIDREALRRLRAEANAARAELSRLRAVVEAVQALCESDPDAERPGWRRVVAIRAALAPVSSSGEARPVLLAWHTCTSCRGRTLGRPGSRCSHCNGDTEADTEAAPSSGDAESGEVDPWPYTPEAAARLIASVSWPFEAVEQRNEWAPKMLTDVEMRTREVASARRRFEQAVAAVSGSPAPVPSGGQADGEGCCEHGIPLPNPTRAAERVLAHVSATGDGLLANVDGAPLYGRDLESVAKAALAARPVLSREALADVLVQQTVRVQVPNVGTVTGFLRRESADHLADVLAGGEQA